MYRGLLQPLLTMLKGRERSEKVRRRNRGETGRNRIEILPLLCSVLSEMSSDALLRWRSFLISWSTCVEGAGTRVEGDARWTVVLMDDMAELGGLVVFDAVGRGVMLDGPCPREEDEQHAVECIDAPSHASTKASSRTPSGRKPTCCCDVAGVFVKRSLER